jgi:hypothetical protein
VLAAALRYASIFHWMQHILSTTTCSRCIKTSVSFVYTRVADFIW